MSSQLKETTPFINVNIEKDYYIENKLNIKTETNFRFAFAAGHYFGASTAT